MAKFKFVAHREHYLLRGLARIVTGTHELGWAPVAISENSYQLDPGNNWFASIEDNVLSVRYRYASDDVMEAYALVFSHQLGLERIV